MNSMQVVEEHPNPVKRHDYEQIAEVYNGTEIGQAVRLDRVYNTTLFRQALERRGLTAADAAVYQRGDYCFIARKTETQMRQA